jgi:hypothetical protein
MIKRESKKESKRRTKKKGSKRGSKRRSKRRTEKKGSKRSSKKRGIKKYVMHGGERIHNNGIWIRHNRPPRYNTCFVIALRDAWERSGISVDTNILNRLVELMDLVFGSNNEFDERTLQIKISETNEHAINLINQLYNLPNDLVLVIFDETEDSESRSHMRIFSQNPRGRPVLTVVRTENHFEAEV